MIDWIKAKVWIEHDPLPTGCVMKLSPSGEVEWQSATGLQVEGSHESSVRLSTETVEDGRGRLLVIDGNLLKFVQGHNLFGTGSVAQVLADGLCAVCDRLGIPYTADEYNRVLSGDFELWRVDCTAMVEYPSADDALQALAAYHAGATMRYRTRSSAAGDTLYFGQRSRRWSLKVYPKGPELRKHGRAFLSEHPDGDAFASWADRCLRFEVVLRRMELDRRELTHGSAWKSGQCLQVVEEAMSALQVGATPPPVTHLPRTLRAAVAAWQAGHDVATLYSRAQYYRVCKAAQAHGINLRLPAADAPSAIPQARIIKGELATVPAAFRTSSAFHDFGAAQPLDYAAQGDQLAARRARARQRMAVVVPLRKLA